MNIALWLTFVLVPVSPYPTETPPEAVVEVDLGECLQHSRSFLTFRVTLNDEISSVDKIAKRKLDAITVAKTEMAIATGADEVQDKQRIVTRLSAEFNFYRNEQQTRLKAMERIAFNDGLGAVRKAVAEVAAQNGYSVVLFKRPGAQCTNALAEKSIEARELIDSPPLLAFVSETKRKDITDLVKATMASYEDQAPTK